MGNFAENLNLGNRFRPPLQNNWGSENNYCVPPFRLIPDILRVVKSQKAHATLIVPMWPGQPWYQEIANLAVTQSPVYLMTNRRSVLASHGKPNPYEIIGGRL